jgi:hypothetical protein
MMSMSDTQYKKEQANLNLRSLLAIGGSLYGFEEKSASLKTASALKNLFLARLLEGLCVSGRPKRIRKECLKN